MNKPISVRFLGLSIDQIVSIDDSRGISIDAPFSPSIDYSIGISIDAFLVKLVRGLNGARYAS